MGRDIGEAIMTILMLIVGVAVLSVILSPKSTTIGTIQAAASGFSNSLATAMSPVTGAHVTIDTSYPGGSSLTGMHTIGLPSFGG